MNITLANLESFQEAIRQASKVSKCSNSSERLQLADNMRQGVTCDFFQLDLNDPDDDDIDEVDDRNNEENVDEFDDQRSQTAEDNRK